MKMLTWLLAIGITTLVGGWLWVYWANRPMHELMFIQSNSVEAQLRHIEVNYPWRLVRRTSAQAPNVFADWAIKESNRRSLILAVCWFVLGLVWTVSLWRGRSAGKF